MNPFSREPREILRFDEGAVPCETVRGQEIRQAGPVGDHDFQIRFLDPGVEAFAFTFGQAVAGQFRRVRPFSWAGRAGGGWIEMHVVSLLKTEMFNVVIDGRPASITELFPDWHPHDRFGLVIDEAFGGIGATHLLQSAMMAYYDIKPSRRTTLTVYPEIYAFHIGKGHGAHAPYDFWPARREVILRTTDHREVLDAINDRGITRLAVPDRPMRDVVHRPKEEDAAFDRIASAFVYSAAGRVADGDVTISGADKRTEYNPNQTLRSIEEMRMQRAAPVAGRPVKETEDTYLQWLIERSADVPEQDRTRARTRREALKTDGLATETYRRVSVSEALKRLASAGLDDLSSSNQREAETISG